MGLQILVEDIISIVVSIVHKNLLPRICSRERIKPIQYIQMFALKEGNETQLILGLFLYILIILPIPRT